MKYVLSLLFGLMLGAGVAATALYFNPLTQNQSDRDGGALVFDYTLKRSATLLTTHDGALGLPVVPAEVPLLFESGIKGSLLTALTLEGRAEVGRAVATRLSVPSPRSELLLSGVLVDDYWLISLPGKGTLFVHSANNQWPLLRDTVVQIDWLGRDWTGPKAYRPTRGPANGSAEVIGLTGRFAGSRGQGSERLTVASYGGSLEALEGELAFELGASP
jgi:hypothetical protein